MTPQEQRIADALIDRIRQRRDTIDPELAQRIHGGLKDIPDAFYLLAQAAVSQGAQIETLQANNQPLPAPPPQQASAFVPGASASGSTSLATTASGNRHKPSRAAASSTSSSAPAIHLRSRATTASHSPATDSPRLHHSLPTPRPPRSRHPASPSAPRAIRRSMPTSREPAAIRRRNTLQQLRGMDRPIHHLRVTRRRAILRPDTLRRNNRKAIRLRDIRRSNRDMDSRFMGSNPDIHPRAILRSKRLLDIPRPGTPPPAVPLASNPAEAC